MTITATHVRPLSGWRGDAALYKLSQQVEAETVGGPPALTDHVIISAVVVPFGEGPETYIFPATADGKAINHSEMPGSRKGTLSPSDVIAAAGWAQA